MSDNLTFEEKMDQLEAIVSHLEQGNVSLEESINQFKMGIDLSKELQTTLNQAEKTITKIIDDNEQEVDFTENQEGTE